MRLQDVARFSVLLWIATVMEVPTCTKNNLAKVEARLLQTQLLTTSDWKFLTDLIGRVGMEISKMK